MAISVLGIGIPSTSPLVPDALREKVQKAIEAMEADMNASAYDWEFLSFTPEMEHDVLAQKLREKNWDIVMVGTGLRTHPQLTPFFERIINTVHEELPKAKFAFNTEIEKSLEACQRVLAP